jgi:hypothetical protein
MQNEFKVSYSKIRYVVWAIIVVPIVFIYAMLAIVLSVKEISDIVLIISIVATLGISIVLLLWIIKTKLGITSMVLPSETGLQIKLSKTNLLYRSPEINFDYAAIKNISYNYDVQHRKYYLLVNPRKGATFQFTALNESPDDLAALNELVEKHRAGFNQNPQLGAHEKIGDTGFYETPFAKVVTWVMIVFTVLITVMLITGTETLPWYKVIWWYVICGVWWGNTLAAKKRRSQQQQNT